MREAKYSALFQPITINNLQLKNRLVVPAMGTGFGTPDGYVSDRLIEYQEARAKGGFGLIIIEVSAIDPRGRPAMPGMLCIYDDSYIPDYRRLVNHIHDAGSKIALQLFHVGRTTTYRYIGGLTPVAPSPVPDFGFKVIPQELTKDEIKKIIEAFAQAAVRAREAGFDAIEIHGAHSYLVAQFMSAYANKRTDEYGGNISGFLRFPVEIIQRTRQLVGIDYPIFFRISHDEGVPLGRTTEQSIMFSKYLAEEGADVIDVSSGVGKSSYQMFAPPAFSQGFNANAASAIKKATDVPVIVAGRIHSPSIADQIIVSGQADLVAIGRQSLADPEWPNKVAEGAENDIVKCLSCNEGCVNSLNKAIPITCVQNPALGREAEYAVAGSSKPKKVLIAGGGPAGLEAGRTAALWGHQVTLFEKAEALGGQIILASIPPGKQIYKEVVDSRFKAINKLGVEIHIREELTAEIVKRISPEVLIVATGSESLQPDLPGIDRENVISAREVFKGAIVGNKIIVIGGGLIGCETADYLAQQGKDVTIIEMLQRIAMDMEPATRYLLLSRLEEKNVHIFTSTTVKAITDDGVIINYENSDRTLAPADSVVIAIGSKPVTDLTSSVKDIVDEVYTAGDASRPGKILDAVLQAAELARNL